MRHVLQRKKTSDLSKLLFLFSVTMGLVAARVEDLKAFTSSVLFVASKICVYTGKVINLY